MRLRVLNSIAGFWLIVSTIHAQGDRLDATAFQSRMKEKGAQLVDVRTPGEFAKGHIAGSINNDWLEDGFLQRAGSLDKSRPVLLYCAAGGRSEEALAAMKEAGFTDVVDLREGFNGWKREGLPATTK